MRERQRSENIRYATPGPSQNEEARISPRPVRLRPGVGRLAVTSARRARPSSAARCFTTLSSRNTRLFTREFVSRSFLVCCAPTLGGDCALRLRIHCRESARRLTTDTASASRFRSAVVSVTARSAAASASRSIVSASLVHSFPLVVGLVRHYRPPCRDIRVLCRGGCWTPPLER